MSKKDRGIEAITELQKLNKEIHECKKCKPYLEGDKLLGICDKHVRKYKELIEEIFR